MCKEKHKVELDLSVIDSFQFCPLCGQEVIEVYVGDYTGHVMCENEDCDGLEFDYELIAELSYSPIEIEYIADLDLARGGVGKSSVQTPTESAVSKVNCFVETWVNNKRSEQQ